MRYGVAALTVLAAVLIKLLLDSVVQQASTFLLLSLAVLVAAVLGGFGAGVFASVLGAVLGDYFFLEPFFTFGLSEPGHTVLAGLFVAQGLATSAIAAKLIEARRKSEEALVDARRAEETLRASERESKRRAELLENAHDAIFTWELGGVVAYWNRGAERLYGWSREEAVGRVSHDLLKTEHPLSSTQELEDILCTEGHWEGEIVHYARDGRRVVVESRHLLTRYDGGVEFVLEANKDITKRKQAEETLRESEERLKRALEAAQFGEWSLDPATGAAHRSLRHDRIFGYEEPLAEWDYEAFLRHVLPEDRPLVDEKFRRVMERGEEWNFECRIRRVDGEVRWIWARGASFEDAAEQPIRVQGLVADITERKRDEEALQRFNETLENRVAERTAQLETVNRELEAFSYSVSHDLRAPLRHISGFAEMLQARAAPVLDETSLRYMGIILDSTERAGDLIDDLLAFSRVGRAEMRRSGVETGRLVRHIVEDLGIEADGRAVEWRIGELPEVLGDPTMLRLVFENLLSNALKYTRTREKAMIEVGSREEKDETVFFVRDNGVGFDEKYAGKLFGVFQRLHRQEEFEGTGIGLANVRRIIHRHGGKVWAEGRPDEGAAFFVSIPNATETTKENDLDE